jgi:hypothetical protein
MIKSVFLLKDTEGSSSQGDNSVELGTSLENSEADNLEDSLEERKPDHQGIHLFVGYSVSNCCSFISNRIKCSSS